MKPKNRTEENLYKEFKALLNKKSKGKKHTEKEYKEAYIKFKNFIGVIYQSAKRQYLRKQKLKKHPKGFHLEEDGSVYNCLICHKAISGKEGWWDLLGQKCLDCQRAIDKKVIPKYVCKNRDIWYADWELKSKFGIHPMTMRKMIREGKLKARILKDKNGAIYEYVFLKEENKNLNKPSLKNWCNFT